MSLRQAADELGVHYMTAYRYVRLGLLPSTREGGTWTIWRSDLERFRRRRAAPAGEPVRRAGSRRRPATARPRLVQALVAGDEGSAWSIVERALANGYAPSDVYLELLAPALHDIGERWESGTATVGEEHRATAVATRVVGRLGPRFVRRGRKRGTVVVGAAPGDPHALPVALLADMLRGAGFHVVDLGADVPIDSFLEAAGTADRLIAVGISVSDDECLDDAAGVVSAVRGRFEVVVLIGGPATSAATSERLGADGWAPDGATAAALLSA